MGKGSMGKPIEKVDSPCYYTLFSDYRHKHILAVALSYCFYLRRWGRGAHNRNFLQQGHRREKAPTEMDERGLVLCGRWRAYPNLASIIPVSFHLSVI